VCGLVSADSRQDPMLGFCKCGKWIFGMHKVKEFLDQLITVRVSTTTAFYEVSQPNAKMET
jgi:hypothetical protein